MKAISLYVSLRQQRAQLDTEIAEIEDDVLAELEQEHEGKYQDGEATVSIKATNTWTYSKAAQKIFDRHKKDEKKIKDTEQSSGKASLYTTYKPRYQRVNNEK